MFLSVGIQNHFVCFFVSKHVWGGESPVPELCLHHDLILCVTLESYIMEQTHQKQAFDHLTSPPEHMLELHMIGLVCKASPTQQTLDHMQCLTRERFWACFRSWDTTHLFNATFCVAHILIRISQDNRTVNVRLTQPPHSKAWKVWNALLQSWNHDSCIPANNSPPIQALPGLHLAGWKLPAQQIQGNSWQNLIKEHDRIDLFTQRVPTLSRFNLGLFRLITATHHCTKACDHQGPANHNFSTVDFTWSGADCWN